MTVHVRTAAKRFERGRDVGAGPWRDLVDEANAITPGTFGRPVMGEWYGGGEVEEYPDARVIHRTDGSVSVVSRTDAGAATLRQAADNLGMHESAMSADLYSTPSGSQG